MKQRFGYIFQDARLLIVSQAQSYVQIGLHPSGKKANVSNLKAEVNLLETPDGHIQTDGEDPTDDSDELTGYFPSLTTQF